jgi:hypothetical protein
MLEIWWNRIRRKIVRWEGENEGIRWTKRIHTRFMEKNGDGRVPAPLVSFPAGLI